MSSQPINRCIYCVATTDLTNEHIMPKALGGTQTLLKASCRTCATKTGEVERRVLKESWGGFRWVLGMPTRRPKERPVEVPVEVRHGAEWHEVMLPVSKYTGAAAFPVFREPPAFRGSEEADLVWDAIRTVTASAGTTTTDDTPAGRAGADGYRIPVAFDPKAMARLLAKIAHGYAVDFFGLDSFEAYLPPAILGDSDDVGRWVGSPGASLFADPPNEGHRIRIGTAGETRRIIAGIQLFANAGAPEYFVVVGELKVIAEDDKREASDAVS